MPAVAVIADDLTGAADTGLPFWNHGLTVEVRLADGEPPDEAAGGAEVRVVSTETRNRPATVAKRRLGRVGRRWSEITPARPILYKKIDSTLRGWVGLETRALLDSLPGRVAWIVPAYPKQGRRLEGGVYTVHGSPIAETEFASAIPGCPPDSRVAPLIERQMGAPIGFIGAEVLGRGPESIAAHVTEVLRSGIRAVLFDAATEEQIRHICAASRHFSAPLLWVGSAGLAEPLARLVGKPGGMSGFRDSPSIEQASNGVVIVAGSRNAVTIRQVAFLKAGVPLRHAIVTLPSGDRAAAGEGSEDLPTNLLLTLPAVDAQQRLPATVERAAVAELGRIAAAVIARSGSRHLILTGGETAAATLRGLRADALELVGVVEEGIPLLRLRGGSADGALVVTKAGGFGSDDSLYHAFQLLAERQIEEASQ